MRATALLQRLPHAADTETRRRRPRRHKLGRRTTATRAPNLRLAPPASGQDATVWTSTGSTAVARTRLAGGPVDNASYTCACGFVFAASVSTTVRCPHCGADQAW